MGYNNQWLYLQITEIKGICVSNDYSNLVQVTKGDVNYNIYAPTSDEYIITIDVVQKVIALGGNIISFPKFWCRPSQEALRYGNLFGIRIMSHSQLLRELK